MQLLHQCSASSKNESTLLPKVPQLSASGREPRLESFQVRSFNSSSLFRADCLCCYLLVLHTCFHFTIRQIRHSAQERQRFDDGHPHLFHSHASSVSRLVSRRRASTMVHVDHFSGGSRRIRRQERGRRTNIGSTTSPLFNTVTEHSKLHQSVSEQRIDGNSRTRGSR